ncbi:hypothetical protein TNCV_3516161 [Trichonephila clavipes]|nr:hypothetical protein TNCV_3516161 [Trichonephila clavipes]
MPSSEYKPMFLAHVSVLIALASINAFNCCCSYSIRTTITYYGSKQNSSGPRKFELCFLFHPNFKHHAGGNTISPRFNPSMVATVAEWYRYRIVACLVTSSSSVPLKTRRVGQRCTLNLSRAETSSPLVWCGS